MQQVTTLEAKSTQTRLSIPPLLVGAAIALIVVTGLIHFIDAPDNLQEAMYKGLLFLANGAAALFAAVGIYRGSKTWGWALGFLVAGGAFVMYIVSRTIGLPGIGIDDDWFEPMGLLSLFVEGAFVLLTIVVATRYRSANR
ncbi:MAG: hypothetical protein U0694_14415 [Anaerolineae bacterium]